MTTSTRTVALAALAGLAAPVAAQAHVTVQPKRATAGTYAVESIRVPNESDDATTTRVAVQMPDGFASVSYAPVPGWTTKVVKSKLAAPVETDDGEITEQVDQITFTAAEGKGVAPGQFQDFPLSVKVPDEPGTLTFKAVQTYDDGEVVRWIGAPDADKPAAQLEVSAATESVGDDGAQKAGAAATSPTVDSAPTAAPIAAGDPGPEGLAVVALVVGGLGLLAGLAGLAAARRRPAAT